GKEVADLAQAHCSDQGSSGQRGHEILISIVLETIVDRQGDNSIFVEIWKSQMPSPHWPRSRRTIASMSTGSWGRRGPTGVPRGHAAAPPTPAPAPLPA